MIQKENNTINNDEFIFSLTSISRIILIIGTYAGLILIISLFTLAFFHKDSDTAIRFLIVFIFFISSGILLYFVRFKAFSINSSGNLKLFKRIGKPIEIKSSNIKFFKIYKISLFVVNIGIGYEDDWNINEINRKELNLYIKHTNNNEGVYNYVYPMKLITQNKKYYFMINEQIALDLENILSNKITQTSYFQESYKSKIGQKWYWLVLVGAIIIITIIFVWILNEK